MPLDPRFVDTVRPAEQPRTFADSAGLSLIVQPNGSKVWSLRYRDLLGVQRRLKLGTLKDGMTLAAARREAEHVRTQAQKAKNDTAVDPHAARRTKRAEAAARREALTFDQLADRFLSEWVVPRKRPRPVMADRTNIRNRLRPRWGTRPASDITKADVLAVIRAIPGTGANRNNVHRLCSKLFRWASSQSLIPANPMADLSLPDAPKTRDRVLSDDELRALWLALDEAERRDPDHERYLRPELGLWLRLRLLTAQRGQEVMAMRWQDVTTDADGRGIWEIPAAVMKGKRPHVVPLSPWVMRLLQARRATCRADAAYVLDGARAKATWSGIGEKLPTFAEPWAPHDLRRTATTNMGRLKVPRFVQQRVLGHADQTVTGIYDRHEYLDEKRDALERWATELTGILKRAELPAARNVLRHPSRARRASGQ